jgi:hypothetical protein
MQCHRPTCLDTELQGLYWTVEEPHISFLTSWASSHGLSEELHCLSGLYSC